jgi:hypothetical protein
LWFWILPLLNLRPIFKFLSTPSHILPLTSPTNNLHITTPKNPLTRIPPPQIQTTWNSNLTSTTARNPTRIINNTRHRHRPPSRQAHIHPLPLVHRHPPTPQSPLLCRPTLLPPRCRFSRSCRFRSTHHTLPNRRPRMPPPLTLPADHPIHPHPFQYPPAPI